ncbi:phospholipid/cholesterol/gamma-HCH transport system permease protein [Silvimonas terrae]|uniref:Phospholipid/cholesterol/gamma-HCH transport system permease protein n=1 Tax=Silvimonas terrae TaxID=300266 RepID=A0A840RBT2_9NEIS|nr:ABC transporter permease [Silvimonas terrae]MBB5190034.1 phospholipid/cholesterol/gamma-HCH transport system permease protein [Silvimonas terrae]
MLRRLFSPVLDPLSGLRHAPARRVLLKQIYFTGNEAALLVLLVGFALGGIVVAMLHGQYGQSQEAALRLLASLGFKEISPLLAAIILVARSSSAVASELATMQVHGEIRSLYRMGIPLGGYLIMPRVLGMTVACVGLSFYLAVAAQLGGALLGAGADVTYQVSELDRMLTLEQVLTCMAKAALFGMGTSLLACHVGLRVGPYVTDIPKASSRAVVRGLSAIFVLDFMWSLWLS